MKITRFLKANLSRRRTTVRRGFITPAVAMAMIVVMAGLALIIDRLWLDAADLELTTACEAAALASAAELVGDDQLSANPDPQMRQAMALSAAAVIASQNFVAGSPVVLNTSPQSDVRFGQLALDTESGLVQFQETADNATTVVVTSLRTRRSSNPVGLFMSGLTGWSSGDVATRVEATVDNRVIGVRPVENTAVPAIPLAIWWMDPTGQRTDTWNAQIVSGAGSDNYRYDPTSHTVYPGQDGIPEITLHSQINGQQVTDANVAVVDIGTSLNDQEIARQFASGWSSNDLTSFGGEFLLPAGSTVSLNASAELRNADRVALESMIGQPRICLLYSAVTPNPTSRSTGQAVCVTLVAVRVLKVTDVPNGGCQVIAQPCVVKTRTAVVHDISPYYTVTNATTANSTTVSTTNPQTNAASNPTTNSNLSTNTVAPNPYIYKLRLTH